MAARDARRPRKPAPAVSGALAPSSRIDGRRLSHAANAAIRRIAVRHVEAGEPPSAVIARFGLARTSIYPWLRAYRAGGQAALARRRHRGRIPRVTAAQAEQVRGWILSRTPENHGLRGTLWTRATVARLVEANFGVRMGAMGAGRLLDRLGIRPGSARDSIEEAAFGDGPVTVYAVDGRGSFLCAVAGRSARRRSLEALVAGLVRAAGGGNVRIVCISETPRSVRAV